MTRRLFTLLLAGALLAGCLGEKPVPDERLPGFQPLAKPPRIALVLGSGGPRGFAHIGVLKVLEEAGLHPDLVVGSSVGAMVGVLYASGLSARDLEKLAQEINVLQFFDFGMLGGKLASGAAMQSYVDKQVGDRQLQELKIPVVVTATRVRDQKLVFFDRGDAGLAVRASAATVEQFEPVKIGSESYVDSDEVSPVPIRAARSLGAKVVIAVDVSAYAEDTPPGVPQEWVVKDQRRAAQVKAESSDADVLLHPNIGYYAGHNEDYRRRVMSAAERYTREQLPAIRAALARVN